MPKKYTYEEIKEEFDEKQYELLSKEYTGYNQKLQYICVCGKKCETTHTSLKSGKISCFDCQIKRNKERFLEKHGVDHPSKTKEFKEKSKQTRAKKLEENPNYKKDIQEKTKATNMEKRGVPYPLMSKEVQEKSKQTIFEKHGVEYAGQIESVKIKAKETSLKKYGTEHPQQNKEIHKKGEETNLKKYGHKNPFQVEEFKEKSKQTNIEKRGVEYAGQSEEVKDKMKATNIERRGVDNPMKSKEVYEKHKQTNLERRGVENVMQDKDVFKKAQATMKTKKKYTFPSGRIEMVQGFEPFALDILLEKGYDEDDIIVGDVDEIPQITYEFEGQEHIFFPDIYIISKDKIIEVKSTYTFNKAKDQNIAKLKACRDMNLVYWIIGKNGDLLEKMKSKNY